MKAGNLKPKTTLNQALKPLNLLAWRWQTPSSTPCGLDYTQPKEQPK